MYNKDIKKQVEIYYKTNDTTITNTAKRFNIPYTTLRGWVESEKWVAGSLITNIETTNNEVLKENYDLVTKKAKESIKREIESNLDILAFDLDKQVLDSLISESSETLLLRAMSLDYINKTLIEAGVIAKNALRRMNMDESNLHKMEHNAMITACSEKVTNIFTKIKDSIYGDIKTTNQSGELDYSSLSDAELLEIINKNQ